MVGCGARSTCAVVCGRCHTLAVSHPANISPRSTASDSSRLGALFGSDALLPLWIAEPYVPLAPPILTAIEERAALGWYGYETRPDSAKSAFWTWMSERHGWDSGGLSTLVSPSVGTSIAVLINELSDPGEGVIIQPPVFTDFKPLITSSNRRVVRNPLTLTRDGYQMDLDGLFEKASDPATRLMILCNPHNPVGRLWSRTELDSVARICADNNVVVISDEIHADLAHPPYPFTPFGDVAEDSGVTWAATHGPIKTFGLAGVCDTLLITDNADIASQFETVSRQLHLTRNNVFATAAFETAYQEGGPWLDDLLKLTVANVERLSEGLNRIEVMPQQATYLAWLDFRYLELDVPELAQWLTDTGLALSPGHWFGREGAGFARMSVAVDPATIEEAIHRLN